MDSIFVYALVTLWLVVMLPAAALPLFMDRSKANARVTPRVSTIQFRAQTGADRETQPPIDRSAA